MSLDLSSLERAVAALDGSLAAAARAETIPAEFRDTLRSGVIQNFEVAYEHARDLVSALRARND